MAEVSPQEQVNTSNANMAMSDLLFPYRCLTDATALKDTLLNEDQVATSHAASPPFSTSLST